MSSPKTDPSDSNGADTQTTIPRRRVLALGAGIGVSLLAGCAGDTGTEPETGEFRLLVSDQPADIGDFDRLDVSFDHARIFEAGSETTTEAPAENTTTTQDGESTQTPTESGTPADTTPVSERVQKADGYFIIDLDGETVDLTTVLGEDATPVFDGELEPGTYTKVELHVADVEGVVDGEEVAVKVPSEKLQITNTFEVTTGEPVEFVFDINVVKKGPTNGYNLLPVISESGVAGQDVEYEEVPRAETETETGE
ncbi:MAG: DUF4382 domain-containing protein [Halodesulfurarchaeum sp.]